MRQAVILAAGQGKRLLPLTLGRPKCLLEVGGKSILEHQVDALLAAGIASITVVTGYLGHKVRDRLGERVYYRDNPLFVETSSMYSLWLARGEFTGELVVMNSDVLFHPGILAALLACPQEDALAVDFEARLAEEETKVVVRDGRVRALGKDLPSGDGENVGMLRFSATGWRVLFDHIEALLAAGHRGVMVPHAVNAMAPGYPLAAVAVGGLPWIEIDFPEDYRRALEVVYPAILNCRNPGLALPGLVEQGVGERH
jgi:choline kinase